MRKLSTDELKYVSGGTTNNGGTGGAGGNGVNNNGNWVLQNLNLGFGGGGGGGGNAGNHYINTSVGGFGGVIFS